MKLTLRESIVLSLLGAVMFCSKLITEAIPNVHFIAMLTMAYTVVFRKKAIYAILVFIMLTGLFYGFGVWWVPYFYLWPILWAVTLLLPTNLKPKYAVPMYMAVGFFHGLFYGTMYAPFQAIVFGLNFKRMIAWIVAGLPWDVIHAVGNLFACSLTVPVINALNRGKNIHSD